MEGRGRLRVEGVVARLHFTDDSRDATPHAHTGRGCLSQRNRVRAHLVTGGGEGRGPRQAFISCSSFARTRVCFFLTELFCCIVVGLVCIVFFSCMFHAVVEKHSNFLSLLREEMERFGNVTSKRAIARSLRKHSTPGYPPMFKRLHAAARGKRHVPVSVRRVANHPVQLREPLALLYPSSAS